MTDMDAYYAAFDIHGEDMECSQCECALESIYVSHWVQGATTQGEVIDLPCCDRCYYEMQYDRDEYDYDPYDGEEQE